MSFSQSKAQSSAKKAAAATAGGIMMHKALGVLAEKAPESMQKYVGFAGALVCVLAPAFVNIKDEAALAALQGGAVVGAYKGFTDVTKDATDGWKASVAKIVPALGSVDLPTYSYQEATQGLLAAGSAYQTPVASKTAVQSLF